MKLIINILDDVYTRLFDNGIQDNEIAIDDVCEMTRALRLGTPLPKCNECKYYEGVHKVQGHAPCSYHTIGGVMWDWYCSQFEADKGNDSE